MSVLSIKPTRAFFRPGEPIGLIVESTQPMNTVVTVVIYHLDYFITRWSIHMNGTHVTLEGHVSSEAKRGYLVQVHANDQTAITAFDVLEHWTQAPRYGFLYDFSAERTARDIQTTFDSLLAFHVNGLQCYDWQYRHDTLLPPQDDYTDPLGRQLSLVTMRALIAAAHQRGMAALPYTAIYAASPEFAAAHPAWEFYDAEQQPFDFANGFLKIMNPASGWRTHFIEQCQLVLENLPFDGIHVDQYGEPQTGFDSAGLPVDLPTSFAELLTELRVAVGTHKNVLFNLVHNWPAPALAQVPLDFWYSELWPPETTFAHLWRTVRANQELNPRPAVLAVYIPPDWEETICAAYCTILASGGAQIIHGDHGRYLSDPYFPKAGMPSLALSNRLKQLADFAVAYEEALVFAEDVTDAWLPFLHLEGMSLDGGKVIVRAVGNNLFVNLLNISGQWDRKLPVSPPLNAVRLTISGHEIVRGWRASPEAPVAMPLTTAELPTINQWLLLGFTFAEALT